MSEERSDFNERKKCPDCHQCQECSRSRCRACLKGGKGGRPCDLGSGFTYGDYLKWKEKRQNQGSRHGMQMKKIPVLDLSRCTDCESCLELCPHIFKRNMETGQLEIVDLHEYPEEDMQQAISICPADCISWENGP